MSPEVGKPSLGEREGDNTGWESLSYRKAKFTLPAGEHMTHINQTDHPPLPSPALGQSTSVCIIKAGPVGSFFLVGRVLIWTLEEWESLTPESMALLGLERPMAIFDSRWEEIKPIQRSVYYARAERMPLRYV